MRCFIFMVFLLASVAAAKKPNIVLVLTDDQDLLLGGITPVKQVQNLIGNKGATFTNAFVSTPICCPSRSTILTGLYQHNHKVLNNSLSGGCSSPTWQQALEPLTYAALLHQSGYTTFYAGKYLNTYGYKSAGGTQHIPKGWDWWIGLVGNSRYYNYTLSVNGSAQHLTDKYLTNVIENYSVEFIESMRYSDKSFLMVLAPPAPHTPYIPEPKYKDKFNGHKVPRTPNFNTHKLKDRHWLLNMEPSPLPNETVTKIDAYFSRRWETLLSVDDMVAATINKIQDIGQLDNTYVLYTSDHGYHLGQYALPWDKRQPYEMDIRVPLMMRGPGIKPKSLVDSVVVNIDIAPTIVDIAGLPVPTDMDGISFLTDAKTSSRLEPRPPRRSFLLEYVGEGERSTVSSQCPLLNDDTLSECYPSSSCKCQDSRNNTYVCVRNLDSIRNFLYCQFYKEINSHMEFYDINQDPYQLTNVFSDMSANDRDNMEKALSNLQNCSGNSCDYKL